MTFDFPKNKIVTNVEQLRAKVARLVIYGVTMYNMQVAKVILATLTRSPSTSTGTCSAPQYRQSAASLLRTACTMNCQSPPSSWSLQPRTQSAPCVCTVPKQHLASWCGQLGHIQPRRAHPLERQRSVNSLWIRVRCHFCQKIVCGRSSLRM